MLSPKIKRVMASHECLHCLESPWVFLPCASMRYLAGTLANPDVFETLVLQAESKYYLCIVVTLRAMLVTLDVSEFHFLFLLIFILFSLACLYMCCWCFPLRCLFQCLFVYLFVLLFYFVFISFLYLFIVYVMWLYFITFSLKVYVTLKWYYHVLFVYWLIVYIVFLKIYRNIVCIIQWNYN